MATTALHKRKPSHDHHEEAEKNPNPCRAVVVKSSSNIGPQPPKATTTTTTTTTTMSSYFFSITIPQPTIRIRIPRLLAKTLQRRTIHHGYSDGDDHGDDDDHHQTNKMTKKKKRKAWPRPKKHLAKTIGSIFSNVFGKRDPPTYSKVNESNDGGGVEVEILDTGGESDDDKPLAVAPESPSFKTFAFEHEDGKERSMKKARKTCMAGKPRKRSHSFTRFFFYNPASLNSTRSNQVDGATNIGCGCIIGKRGIIADMPDANGPVIRINPVALPVHDFASKAGFGSVRQQTEPGIRIVRPRLKMVRSMRKKPKRQNADDAELCKKRILMGGKCKPLHSLRYDSDGILLPELNL